MGLFKIGCDFYPEKIAVKLGKKPGEITEEDINAIYDYLRPNHFDIDGVPYTAAKNDYIKDVFKIFDALLPKLKRYRGTVGKNLQFADDEQLDKFLYVATPGVDIEFESYLRCFKGETRKEEGSKVKLIIKDSKLGRDMSSIYHGEGEILYEAYSRFRVLKHANGHGQILVYLKELE